jgi:hypothetical protein
MYEIEDIKKFSKSLGKRVAKDCGFSVTDLKSSISVKNVCCLVKENSSVIDGVRFIDEQNAIEVCEQILNWIMGVSLAKMAANDEIDCYWSDKDDCMMFMFKGDEDQTDFVEKYFKS